MATSGPELAPNRVLEDHKLYAEIISLKVKNALLMRKRRLLLEELYYQHLEGENEPKKKRKQRDSDTKKRKNPTKKAKSPKEESEQQEAKSSKEENTVEVESVAPSDAGNGEVVEGDETAQVEADNVAQTS